MKNIGFVHRTWARCGTGIATLALAVAVVAAPLTAFAQGKSESRDEPGPVGGEGQAGVIYQRKTIVTFDDDTIDGKLLRPDGERVEARKRVGHSNLLRIRENFRENILRSVFSI